MHRLITVAALLFLATACSDDKPNGQNGPTTGATPPTTTASAPATAVPSTPGVAGGATKEAVCAAYLKAEGEAGNKFIAILPKAADAMSDPGKAPAVLTELKAALKTYETALTAEAARSADGQLRAAISADLATLAATVKAVESAGNDMEKVLTALNSPEFQQLGDKVKSLCGK